MKKQIKIVYIDGDSKYRKKVKGTFAEKGYKWVLCCNGEEGLDRIYEVHPDIVIVDYFLSDITAEEVYTQFLLDSRFKSIKTIPFIGLTSNGEKEGLYNLGFNGCLGKPFRPKELAEFIEDVIVSNGLKLQEINYWETIRKSKDFLERLVESSVDSIITTDDKGIITFCNGAAEEMLEYSFEEIVGQRVSSFLENGNSELI